VLTFVRMFVLTYRADNDADEIVPTSVEKTTELYRIQNKRKGHLAAPLNAAQNSTTLCRRTSSVSTCPHECEVGERDRDR
jgi:hypothetical protein